MEEHQGLVKMLKENRKERYKQKMSKEGEGREEMKEWKMSMMMILKMTKQNPGEGKMMELEKRINKDKTLINMIMQMKAMNKIIDKEGGEGKRVKLQIQMKKTGKEKGGKIYKKIMNLKKGLTNKREIEGENKQGS